VARMMNHAMTMMGAATMLPAAKIVANDSPSRLCNGPMPNAVYFTTTGIAFHQGDTAVQSHGCIRLSADASLVFGHVFERGRRGDCRRVERRPDRGRQSRASDQPAMKAHIV